MPNSAKSVRRQWEYAEEIRAHEYEQKKNRISAAKRVEEYNQENLEIAKISINISKNSIFANRVIGFSVLLFLF